MDIHMATFQGNDCFIYRFLEIKKKIFAE